MEFTPIFFSGGLKCIDFCNTYDHFQTPPVYDLFPDRATIVKWGLAAGILPADLEDSPSPDGESFAHTLAARSLIFRLFMPFTRFETPAEEDFVQFNALFREVSGKLEIATTAQGYGLACRADDALELVLCEVVRSAADLLLSNQTARIKQCEECGWLFYDATRNRSRRWCDMNSCGNRAKARRHYEKVRQKREVMI